MKYEEAVRQCQEIGAQMQHHADTAARAASAYQAHMQLFTVAAETEDAAEMDKERVATLQAVETILDSGAMVAKLRNELNRIARSAEMPR